MAEVSWRQFLTPLGRVGAVITAGGGAPALQAIGTVPRLRPEEERELACDLHQPLLLEKGPRGIAEGADEKSPTTRSAPIASAHARELMITANLRMGKHGIPRQPP
jgi:hypothetical protein